MYVRVSPQEKFYIEVKTREIFDFGNTEIPSRTEIRNVLKRMLEDSRQISKTHPGMIVLAVTHREHKVFVEITYVLDELLGSNGINRTSLAAALVIRPDRFLPNQTRDDLWTMTMNVWMVANERFTAYSDYGPLVIEM